MKITQTITPKDVFKQYSSVMFKLYVIIFIVQPLLVGGLSYYATNLGYKYTMLILLICLVADIFFAIYLRWSIFNIVKRKFDGKKYIEIFFELNLNNLKGRYFDDVDLNIDDIHSILKRPKHFVIITGGKENPNFVLKIDSSSQNFIKNLCSELGINL